VRCTAAAGRRCVTQSAGTVALWCLRRAGAVGIGAYRTSTHWPIRRPVAHIVPDQASA